MRPVELGGASSQEQKGSYSGVRGNIVARKSEPIPEGEYLRESEDT